MRRTTYLVEMILVLISNKSLVLKRVMNFIHQLSVNKYLSNLTI